jgi:hypothetical protein
MIADGNPMRTVFANTIDTAMPFNGYLRELKCNVNKQINLLNSKLEILEYT